jgi:hypothetical protein
VGVLDLGVLPKLVECTQEVAVAYSLLQQVKVDFSALEQEDQKDDEFFD